MPLPSNDEVAAEKARRHLNDFIRLAWPVVEPGTEYQSNWHIEAICDHLEAVTNGELKRLVINIPPRHMKSLSVAVFWPCWVWLTRPETRWLFSSYAQTLSTRDSVKCRRVIESVGTKTASEERTLIERVGYQGLLKLLNQNWQLTSDQNVKNRFENNRTGYRIATSVGGSATGEGGDIVVVDDPHKADEATSDVKRTSAVEWWDQTMTTRLNDQATGALVVIMQRLHEQDLAGHLIEKGYEHLVLPAEYEPSHPFVWPDDPRTEPGELLWPERNDRATIDGLKNDLGSYAAAGQLQQRPAPLEGGIFKRHWWRYYNADSPPQFQRLYQSWDTTFKDKTTSDYVVGGLWGVDLANCYLLRVVRGRWDLVETISQLKQLHQWAQDEYPHLNQTVLMENTANGPEIIGKVRKQITGIIPVNVNKDKVQRALAVTPMLEAGNVFVPGAMNAEQTGPDTALTPGWTQELIEECAGFPNGSHDDQVDMLTQFLNRIKTSDKTVKVTGKGSTTMSGLTADSF